MLSSGNGRPERCAANILSAVRGEIPYSRMKGRDPSYVDRPSSYSAGAIRFDLEWLIKTYEPRVDLKKVSIEALTAQNGEFALNTDLVVRGAEQ